MTALCDDLEADHQVLHGLLDQMLDRGTTLRARARVVLRDLHGEFCRHLDREESEGKAVIFDVVPASQWEEWELQVRRGHEAPGPHAAAVADRAHHGTRSGPSCSPPRRWLLEVLYRAVWRRRYERTTRLVYGTLPALPGVLPQPAA